MGNWNTGLNKGRNCKDELKLVKCNDPLVKSSSYNLAKKQTFFIVAVVNEDFSYIFNPKMS